MFIILNKSKNGDDRKKKKTLKEVGPSDEALSGTVKRIDEDDVTSSYSDFLIKHLSENDYSTFVDLEDEDYADLQFTRFYMERGNPHNFLSDQKFYLEVDSRFLDQITT